MNAADLMMFFVVSVKSDATIQEAAQLMLQYRISGLPVTDGDGAVLASSPRAICCAAPRPARRSVTPDGSRSSSVRGEWRKNTCVHMRAKSAS